MKPVLQPPLHNLGICLPPGVSYAVQMTEPDVPARQHPTGSTNAEAEVLSRAGQAQARGDLAEARALCEGLLAIRPEQADALDLLGVVLCQQGEPEAGVVKIAKACAADPGNAGYLNNLGTAFSGLQRDHDALLTYQRVLELKPDYATTHNNIATLYRRFGNLNQAVAHYQKAIGLQPDYAEALSNYGNVLMDFEEMDKAAEVLEKALRLRPDYEHAHNNLGIVRQRQGRYREAESLFQKAIELAPDFVDAYANQAEVLKETGRAAAALGFYEQALQRDPGRASVHSNYLFALNNLGNVSDENLFQAHRIWDERHGAFDATSAKSSPEPDRKLRIGYVSPDFRRHSVSYFFEPLLAHHDRQQFEVTCYSNSLIEDEVTGRLKSHSKHWHRVYGMPDTDLFERVQQDQIDILVDLSGHTMGNRLPVFARKPSPIQMSYLGYPATTGLSAIDYRLTDALADPVGQTEAFHTEELLRLDDGFLCYQPPVDAPDVNPLPYETNGYITFGSCNSLAKITPEVVAVWAKILQATPGAKLLLKGKALGDQAVRGQYYNLFEAAGVEAERLDLRSWITGASHLAIYHHMDIALDPFPYNGTTTICETAWMGVPTLALEGSRHAARVALSLNRRIGNEDLVTPTIDAYIQRAIDLAGDPDTLAIRRRNLRSQMNESPLCDGPAFARVVEAAFREAWRRYCASSGSINAF